MHAKVVEEKKMEKILAKITLIILLLMPVVAHSEETVYWADNEWVCVIAGTCDATADEYLILKEPSLDMSMFDHKDR